MEQVLSSGSSMITEASGNAREIAEQIGAQPTLEGLIVTGIVGLLICFFGLKLIRLQAALVGFLMGALIGIGVAWTAGISGLTFAIVVFACGAVVSRTSCCPFSRSRLNKVMRSVSLSLKNTIMNIVSA